MDSTTLLVDPIATRSDRHRCMRPWNSNRRRWRVPNQLVPTRALGTRMGCAFRARSAATAVLADLVPCGTRSPKGMRWRLRSVFQWKSSPRSTRVRSATVDRSMNRKPATGSTVSSSIERASREWRFAASTWRGRRSAEHGHFGRRISEHPKLGARRRQRPPASAWTMGLSFLSSRFGSFAIGIMRTTTQPRGDWIGAA